MIVVKNYQQKNVNKKNLTKNCSCQKIVLVKKLLSKIFSCATKNFFCQFWQQFFHTNFVVLMVKTKSRPEKSNARDRVRTQVDDLIHLTRKWTRRLFADTAAIKHIRDVVHKLPKQRQRHLLSKFTSMARLKTFRDVADFSRPSLKSLPSEFSKYLFEKIDIGQSWRIFFESFKWKSPQGQKFVLWRKDWTFVEIDISCEIFAQISKFCFKF